MFLKGRLFPIKKKIIFLLRISICPITKEMPSFSVFFFEWRGVDRHFSTKRIYKISNLQQKENIIFTDHTEFGR